jgi:carbonic anhydrase
LNERIWLGPTATCSMMPRRTGRHARETAPFAAPLALRHYDRKEEVMGSRRGGSLRPQRLFEIVRWCGASLCGAAALGIAVSAGAEGAHWGYGPADGPATWSKLSAEYAVCGAGQSQSPVNLNSMKLDSSTASLEFNYQPASLKIARHGYVSEALNNGHTVQINVDEGNELAIGNTRYRLLQYHFHAPSEHTTETKRFPMEIHLVHRDSTGRLAVVGVPIAEGMANPFFERLWEHLPADPGSHVHHENIRVDAAEILPKDHHWYRYEGSLTTPPCTEEVSWLVAAKPIEFSKEQIAAFTSLYSGNARPLQAQHERVIVYEKFE